VTTLSSHLVGLPAQVSSSRESLYDLADLAPHGCIPLIELTTQLTHLEILLARPTTTAAVAQRSVADATVAALRVLDDLARAAPLSSTPFATQLTCCRALFLHLKEAALSINTTAA